MRLYRLTAQDVANAVSQAHERRLDENGNARLTGEAADSRRILVLVARHDPELVITVFPRG